jgi:hypothetical protein
VPVVADQNAPLQEAHLAIAVRDFIHSGDFAASWVIGEIRLEVLRNLLFGRYEDQRRPSGN